MRNSRKTTGSKGPSGVRGYRFCLTWAALIALTGFSWMILAEALSYLQLPGAMICSWIALLCLLASAYLVVVGINALAAFKHMQSVNKPTGPTH